jgi:hypothetical protein
MNSSCKASPPIDTRKRNGGLSDSIRSMGIREDHTPDLLN